MREPDFRALRTAMVDSQLKTVGVSDAAVLSAFAAIPREAFVPQARRQLAYLDGELPLSPGRALTEPLVLGLLFQTLRLRPTDHVLIVGAATGYATAIAASLATSVVALEEVSDLATAARANLEAAGGDPARATVVEGPLAAGWPELAPYDAMLIDGMVADLPRPLLEQLKDGGRFATVLIGPDRVARAGAGRASGGGFAFEPVIDSRAPALPGFAPAARFRF